MVGACPTRAGQRFENEPRVAGHGGHIDVARPLPVAVHHVGHLGVTEAAEPEAEVERGAEDDDEIGALLEQAARTQERQGMIGGQRAAAETVEEAGHAQMLSSCAQGFPRTVPVDIAADDEGRPFGLGHQRNEAGQLVGVG